MSRVPVKRLIGMARDFDGLYRPTNENSAIKIRIVLRERGFIAPAELSFDAVELSVLRDQARQAGYKVVTTAGRFFPTEKTSIGGA